MSWVCKDCGNKELFKQEIEEWGRCNYVQNNINLVHGYEEEVQDTIEYGDETHEDYDCDDSETGNPTCNHCNSENVLYVEESDWDKWEHMIPEIRQKNWDSENEYFNENKPINNDKLKELKEQLMR